AVQQKICEAIAAGNYQCVAAAYVGIAPETLTRWLARGEKEPNGVYGQFCQAIKDAEARAEVHLVALIRNAATENWTAAMTLLERRHPERWGRRDRTEHTGEGGGPIKHEHTGFGRAAEMIFGEGKNKSESE